MKNYTKNTYNSDNKKPHISVHLQTRKRMNHFATRREDNVFTAMPLNSKR